MWRKTHRRAHARVPPRSRAGRDRSARARIVRVDHRSRRALASALRRSVARSSLSALRELSPVRRLAAPTRHARPPRPSGHARLRRSRRPRHALRLVSPRPKPRDGTSSRRAGVAPRAEVDGVDGQVPRGDLRASERPGAQRRTLARQDRGARGARSDRRVGMVSRSRTHSRSGRPGALRRARLRLGRYRRGVSGRRRQSE